MASLTPAESSKLGIAERRVVLVWVEGEVETMFVAVGGLVELEIMLVRDWVRLVRVVLRSCSKMPESPPERLVEAVESALNAVTMVATRSPKNFPAFMGKHTPGFVPRQWTLARSKIALVLMDARWISD